MIYHKNSAIERKKRKKWHNFFKMINLATPLTTWSQYAYLSTGCAVLFAFCAHNRCVLLVCNINITITIT